MTVKENPRKFSFTFFMVRLGKGDTAFRIIWKQERAVLKAEGQQKLITPDS